MVIDSDNVYFSHMAEVLHILLLELGSPSYIQTLLRVDIQIF